jgi:glycosyltransferase 2 family protein
VAIVILGAPIATRRWRVLGYLVVATVAAAGVMWLVLEVINRDNPSVVVNEIAECASVTVAASTGVIGFAQIAAAFTVVGPFVSSSWPSRSAPQVGAAVLLAFGRPDRRPTASAIRLALVEAGLPATGVHAAKVAARGSTPYMATLDSGSGLFVKVLGEGERAADLMFRFYRYLRLEDVGDDRPFVSLRRAVEHERWTPDASHLATGRPPACPSHRPPRPAPRERLRHPSRRAVAHRRRLRRGSSECLRPR